MKTHVLLLVILLSITCRPPQSNKTSASSFQVTGSAEAMPFFEKGLRMLHNFQYVDAKEAFIEAQKKDPEFAMAYWGEAMSYDHPIWRSLEVDNARRALTKLAEDANGRLRKAKTELERDLIASVNILFGPGSKPDREKAYSSFMEKLHRKYPDNNDVAAFYALSLLGIKNGWAKMEEMNFKAASTCRDILKRDPKHPGALHYLVHANDHPNYAKNSLDAADQYAKVASYSDHALHMPSHIYLALGMWDDVVRSNEVSWQASIDRKKARNATNNELGYHSHRWLAYGYLQQGRTNDALRLLREQIKYTNELASPIARVHLVMMMGDYAVNTMNWEEEAVKTQVKVEDLTLPIRSLHYFSQGLKAFRKKDNVLLEQVITTTDTEIKKAEAWKQSSTGTVICGVQAAVNRIPTQHDIDVATVVKLHLQGLQAWMNGNLADAEKYIKLAAQKEDNDIDLSGPPPLLKPAHELYGEFLLALNRPADASKEFEKAMATAPNRLATLKGALVAAQRLQANEQIELIRAKMPKG